MEDDEGLLLQYLNDSFYNNHYSRKYLLSDNGATYFDSSARIYCTTFSRKDTIIKLILNMDKGTVKYKINEKEYAEISESIDTSKKYRFAINMCSRNEVVELL